MSKQIGKSPLVNNFVRWLIVISAFIITLTLVISWTLWITMYRSTIDDSLTFFGNKTIAQGYGINFDFLVLSIISLGVALIAFLFALPLVFYRKKTGFTVFVSLFNFILAALILVAAILFIMTSYNFYGDFYNVYGLNKTLIVFLPWVIVIVFDFFLLFGSLWSLISAANGVNFVPSVETEAKAQIQEREKYNALPVEEKVIIPTETIIIPQQAAPTEVINQPTEVIVHEEPKVEEKHETAVHHEPVKDHHEAKQHETAVHHETKKHEEEKPESVMSTSHVGPFAVYQENEYGAYVLLKDYTLGENDTPPTVTPVVEETPEDKSIKEVGKKKLKGVRTPKIEEIAPVVANPPAPAPEKKEKIKPISNWTQEQIEEIWNKAQIINDVNPKLYRKDYAGAWMFRDAFTTVLEETNVRSYAWTIVNHRPLSHDGDNSIDNLDPMNVTNALTKGEDYPKWKTKISSSGNENILKEQSWKARL